MKNSLGKAIFVSVVGMVGIFLSVVSLMAQTPQIEWVRQFGTIAPQNDSPQAIDEYGNIYITGSSTYSRDYFFLRKLDPDGNEIWKREVQHSYSGGNALCVDSTGIYLLCRDYARVFKFDQDGTQLWVKSYIFGISSASASGICADGSGIYVLGTFYGSSLNKRDVIICRCDTSGNRIWARQFGTSEEDWASGICADSTGVYVSGHTHGLLPGQTSTHPADAFIRKYDSSGNEIWTRQFGSEPAWSQFCDDRYAYICTYGSSLYIVGWTTGVFPGQTNPSGQYCIFIQKCDLLGNEIWTRQFGASRNDMPYSIDADVSGIYVTGYTYGALPGQTSLGGIDAFVRKYDGSGNVIWTRQFGTPAHEYARSISVGPTGLYVTGQTHGTFPGCENYGQADGFVRKYDINGGEAWTRQFGTFAPANDIARAVDASGNVYVAGYTWGILPGQQWAGYADVFLRKYDPSGNELWTRQFGTSNYDYVGGLCVDSTGVYVTGSESGSTVGFVRKFDFDGNEAWHHQVIVPNSQNWVPDVCALNGAIYIIGRSPALSGLDVYVRKLNATTGEEIWTRPNESQTVGTAPAIAADITGVYVAGYSGSGSASDAFLWKYAEDGTLLWTQWFGTDDLDQVSDVCTDSTGVYVVGFTYGSFPGQTSHGSTDAFIRKFSAAGIVEWTRQFGGSYSDHAEGVDADSQGVYITGESPSSGNAFVQAYSAGGDAQWTFEFVTTGHEYGYGISADALAVYVVGYIQGGIFPGQTSEDDTGTDAFIAKIQKPNLPPIAEISVPNEANVGIPVLFNGTLSSDPDGTIMSYEWDFGDGETGSGDMIYHAYAEKGTYIVMLTVIDDKGATATDTATVQVINAPPVANAGPDQVIEGIGPMTPLILDGSGSNDPDGDIIAYSWADSSGTIVGTTPNVILIRGLESYIFTLTVTDPAGLSSSDSVSITIQDTTPPSLIPPPDLTRDQSDPYGTPVSLGQPTVDDACDPYPTVDNNALDMYPLGVTEVIWTASDASGNVAEAVQLITIVPGPPANQLSNMSILVVYSVAEGKIDPELETSIRSKVAAASNALARGNPNDAKAAMNELKALINQVEAQTDKKIAPDTASEIIAWANQIIVDLGG